MSDNDDRNEDGIYRADTVPPPDGGDDAYNAPTRVGPMAATVVNEMLVAAQAAQSAERAPTSKVKPKSGEGVDGGELDDRDIEAELDPTAFPPPPRVPGSRAPASLRAPPPPQFSSPPASAPVGRPVRPSAPEASQPAPAPAPVPAASPAPANTASSSTRLPMIVLACAGVAALLMALAYAVVATLGGR